MGFDLHSDDPETQAFIDQINALMKYIGDPHDQDREAALVAAYIRYAIEDLHASQPGLTDDVMAKLNPLIRRAVYEVLEVLATTACSTSTPSSMPCLRAAATWCWPTLR